MRRGNKYDRPFCGYFMRAPWSDLPEEYIYNDAEEEYHQIVKLKTHFGKDLK